MNITIIRKTMERLRLRMGRNKITKEQGKEISTLLLRISGVEQVKVTVANGGILVRHGAEVAGHVQGEVIDFLARLDVRRLALTTQTKEESLLPEGEDSFRYALGKLVLGHTLRKYLLPTVIVPWYTWYRSRLYLWKGLLALSRGQITVDLLDATAIAASLLTKEYATASSTMFLLRLSELLLDYSNFRAKNQLTQSLFDHKGKVWLVEGSDEHEVSLDTVTVGQIIRVRAGAMVPVDGIIHEGDAQVNESTMTGESVSVHKSKGSSVFAGTVVEEGEMDICVRTHSSETRIAQIVDFIQEGEEKKASIQGKAERWADQVVPFSLGLFAATYLFTRNLTRAMSVLVVDFSCAIKLTTPIAVISALKEGAEQGIVIKGGKYLERMSKVNTVVFDKTGTLTEAVPRVSQIIVLDDTYSKEEILRIAACLEEHFPHSVAAAIVQEAKNQQLLHPEFHEKVEYLVAHGIVATVEGQRYIIGSRHFIFEDEAVPYPSQGEEWMNQQVGSDSGIYLAIEKVLVGIICIYDPPRPEAKAVIAELRHRGMGEMIMLTGDNPNTAATVAKDLDLDDYVASILPEGKATKVEALKRQGKTVLMLGDGINDAPALSCADVSLTMAGSSEMAREVADISIHSHNLEDVLRVRDLSTALMSRISWHYAMIVAFNGLLLATGAMGWTSVALNAWLHNGSTLLFAGLSTRPLLKDTPPKKEENIDNCSY